MYLLDVLLPSGVGVEFWLHSPLEKKHQWSFSVYPFNNFPSPPGGGTPLTGPFSQKSGLADVGVIARGIGQCGKLS